VKVTKWLKPSVSKVIWAGTTLALVEAIAYGLRPQPIPAGMISPTATPPKKIT
jgi:hypothetical protein